MGGGGDVMCTETPCVTSSAFGVEEWAQGRKGALPHGPRWFRLYSIATGRRGVHNPQPMCGWDIVKGAITFRINL